jgi:hypothetical protein
MRSQRAAAAAAAAAFSTGFSETSRMAQGHRWRFVHILKSTQLDYQHNSSSAITELASTHLCRT